MGGVKMSPGKPVDKSIRARGGYYRTLSKELLASRGISEYHRYLASRVLYSLNLCDSVHMALGWHFIPEEMCGENPLVTR